MTSPNLRAPGSRPSSSGRGRGALVWTVASTIAGIALVVVIAGPYIAALVLFLLSIAATVTMFEVALRRPRDERDAYCDRVDRELDERAALARRARAQETWAQDQVRPERRVVPFAGEGRDRR